MTDRHAGYIVVLADDTREDYAEDTLNALRMVKGVISVTPVIADHYEQSIERQRRDMQWHEALAQLARNGPGKDERQ